MFNCCCNTPSPAQYDRFTGCDGLTLSDELLRLQMASAIAREDYEDAHIIQQELQRRISGYLI